MRAGFCESNQRAEDCPRYQSALPCGRALDFVQRRRVFQRRGVAEFFAETGSAHNAAHHFCVARFWYVADEQNFLGSERFAEMGGERVF